MPVSSVQYGQVPWFYTNGLQLSNDSVAPDTIIRCSTGSTLDSTGVYQIEVTAALEADISVSGINGLDTGTVAASTVYNVFLIADPVSLEPDALLISLSATQPLMPFNYSVFKRIGYIVTDGTSDILLGYWSAGNSATRQFTFDAPILALNAGTQTSYTGVALTTFVPAVDNTPVVIYSDFTANAAADIENLQGFDSTGDAVTIIAPVAGATAHTTSQNTVLAQLNTAAPSIKYKVSAGSLSLYVCGYTFYL